MTFNQFGSLRYLAALAIACLPIAAQSIYPPAYTFSGEPYNSQPVAPNFFLYVPNIESDSASGFAINSASGALTPIPGSPFSLGTGSQPNDFAVDPTGRCGVSMNVTAQTVQSYSIDSNSGTLTPYGSPVAVGSESFAIAIDPSGRFVYVADHSSGGVYGFLLESGDCQLDPIPNSPFAGLSEAYSALVDPSGRFLYVAVSSVFPGYVEGYAINPATGALTPVPNSPVQSAMGGDTNGLAITPSGRFLYATNSFDNTISMFSIDQTSGALNALTPGSVAAGGIAPTGLAIHPSGAWLYAAIYATGGSVALFAINNTTGLLSLLGSPLNLTGVTGTGPLFPGIDPGGNFLYTADYGPNGLVTTFSINQTTGAVTQLGNTPVGSFPFRIVPAAPTAYQNNQFTSLFQ